MSKTETIGSSASMRRTAMIAGGSTQRIRPHLLHWRSYIRLHALLVISDINRQRIIFWSTFTSETDIPGFPCREIVRDISSNHRSTALVWTDMDGLEDAYAALPSGRCHFFVDADCDVEAMPILAGAFGRGGMDRLHDRDRDVEFGSLHRISDELAEFARTLARMADTDPKHRAISDKAGIVSARACWVHGFPAFPASAMQFGTRRIIRCRRQLREIIKLRRLRDRFFHPIANCSPTRHGIYCST